jgi:glucosamine-6-phosphate deaminase
VPNPEKMPLPNPAPAASFRAGMLDVRIYPNREAMGAAAAAQMANRLHWLAKQREIVPVIFATGESQLPMLRALTSIADLPWTQVIGFHMDEYIGLPADHPASFRRYLRENLARHVPLRQFYEIDGSNGDPETDCRSYADLLRAHPPLLTALGIGENGHLAFNDPGVADFHDPVPLKIVSLDAACRQQQVNEGWFSKLAEVPRQAITLTIPTLFRVPELIVSVPGPRKAKIVREALEGPISPKCPATILRTHSNAVVFLDEESAAEVHGRVAQSSE